MHSDNASTSSLTSATGKIRYTFLNNYMFISILENNLDILKSLVRALLHLDDNEDIQIKVENPVNYADSVREKTYILDIKITFSNNSVLNLEMQVNDYGDYNYRATQYLARIYDRVLKGKSYLNSPTAIHIGFLNYNLFEDEQEFYSQYLMENVRSHRVFNDRFDMRIIRMNLTDLATAEDKKYKIDEWVRLFKAKTWEELKMAATTLDMKNAAEKLYTSNMSEQERYYAEAYEDFIRNEERRQWIQAELERRLEEKDQALAEQAELIKKLQEEIARLKMQ